MNKTISIVTVIHYEDEAGKASVWAVPGELSDESEYSVLKEQGTKMIGPVPYEAVTQLENGLLSVLSQIGVRTVKLTWGEE